MVDASAVFGINAPSPEEMNRLFGEASLRARERIAELDALVCAAGEEAQPLEQISLQSFATDIFTALQAPFRRSSPS